jgi:hypothetical protein
VVIVQSLVLLALTMLGEHLSSRKDSVTWVRERTLPTERPPLVGEVSNKFCG